LTTTVTDNKLAQMLATVCTHLCRHAIEIVLAFTDNEISLSPCPDLPALSTLKDHSQIEYTPFEKCFYEEDPEIFAMTEVEVRLALHAAATLYEATP
jgi:hypothetical protein